MPVWQTVLIYVVIPLAVVLFLASLTLPGGRKRPRWKSGQPWPHEPVWYEPHPEALGHGGEEHGAGDGATHGATALGAGHQAKELTAGSDDAAHAVAGGPLGGARGTW